MPEIELSGINGGNLLAFLAALGALRVLSDDETESDVRMCWKDDGYWRPVIQHPRIDSANELVDTISRKVCGEESMNSSWQIGQDLSLSRIYFRECLAAAGASATLERRSEPDFLAALGCDIFGSGTRKEQISVTEFRTMSGAGHQHFLAFMKELARTTDSGHIERALLHSWDYADSRPSLRFDPADYRPHALRPDDPSGAPIQTMRGANRLAAEALPLFPTVAAERRVRTVAFQERNSDMEMTWPIWTDLLDLGTISSLLALEGLQESDLTRNTMSLSRRGITQVYRVRRFTDGKYRNFSPARALL